MRKYFFPLLIALIATLTMMGCSGSSGSSSQSSSRTMTQSDEDRAAREMGFKDSADMNRRMPKSLDDIGSSSSSQSSSSSESSSGTITLDMSDEDRRELLGDDDEVGVSSRSGRSESYSSSPGGSTQGGYTYSSPPNTYSSPSYGQSTMGGYGAGVESRIQQQRSADSIQRDEEARRLNAIRNGP